MLRSNRADVRNPLLALPAAQAIMDLPPDSKSALRDLLLDIKKDAARRAQECWKKHKAPMAVYWKVVSVYTGHIARLLR
jgi:hypothetical protein